MDPNPTEEMRTQMHAAEDHKRKGRRRPHTGQGEARGAASPHLDLRCPTSSHEKTKSCCFSR